MRRFMIDTDMPGMSWIEVPAGNYRVVQHGHKRSTCQIEVAFAYDSFISLGAEDEWSKIAPLRILSFGAP